MQQVSNIPPKQAFNPRAIRADFPILETTSNGRPLVYLDNGATTQKPRAVIDAIVRYYERENANIHRGVYHLSQLATDKYEAARQKVRRFINAAEDREIIFTRGTTEAINLVASSFSRAFVKPGDQIVVSNLEHHSNIVPWQLAAEAHGATLSVIPMNDRGELLLDEYAKILRQAPTKIVAVNHISNSLGTINDVKEMARLAHEHGAKILIDGAQWVAHYPTDVREIDADFYCFSGHKLYGPTGIGVLYGKRAILEAMPPYQGGGDMIASVTFAKSTWAELPSKFEAGTPDIAGAIGLGAAIDYVSAIGVDKLAEYEDELTQYLTEQIGMVPRIRIIGTAGRKGGICSFVIEEPPLAAHDVGVMLDLEGIAIRTGHHCCQPVMDRFKVSATARASLAMYNTYQDVDALVRALTRIVNEHKPRVQSAPTKTAPVGVKYPEALASSPTAAADELAEAFEFLGERDERNRHILDLGEQIPAMPDALKNDDTRVRGCMSTVHLFGRKKPGSTDVLEFIADSDAHIVRGLIVVLEQLFSGQRAKEILAFDVEGFFRRINLDQFISSQRRNGLAGMVDRIRSLAKQIEEGKTP